MNQDQRYHSCRPAAVELCFFKLIKLVFQGEAGRDGLSLPGLPGPPGPPGPIINLQDVNSENYSPLENGGSVISRFGSIILMSFFFSFSFYSTIQPDPSISQGFLKFRDQL